VYPLPIELANNFQINFSKTSRNVRIAVLFLMVGLYFLLACLAAWLILFPSGRELFTASLIGVGRRIGQKFSRLESNAVRKTASVGKSVRFTAEGTAKVIRQHYWLFLVGAAIIGLPPLIAILASSKHRLDGFDTSVHEANIQIAELLQGEQLVAPAPLPPAVFSTQEVLLVRPMLVGASRNWELLNPDFKQRLLLVFKLMKEKYNYDMAIIEGYRSPERQDMLAKLGSNVTNAKAFQSYHQFGLAADCAFYRNGKLVISEKDPWAMKGYELYGELAESAGLKWGGRWKMMDLGHTEFRLPNVLLK
jgi:peptidoglycan L-alanyl-D-glutamate endopeptidase CwlK